MQFAVLATGPSLALEQVEAVKHLPTIAVSNAYQLAPWALAVVAADKAWWRRHAEAMTFPGRRFALFPECDMPGLEIVKRTDAISYGTNSGLLACHVAMTVFGASRLLLLGFDMRGTHYFGPHVGLKNTSPERFAEFRRQFARWRPKGVEVINCTPGSALTCFPTRSLDACLAEPALQGQ